MSQFLSIFYELKIIWKYIYKSTLDMLYLSVSKALSSLLQNKLVIILSTKKRKSLTLHLVKVDFLTFQRTSNKDY